MGRRRSPAASGSLTRTVGGLGGCASDDLLELALGIGTVDCRMVARAADGVAHRWFIHAVLRNAARHRDRQAAEREAAGELWTEHDLVFPTSIGTPIEPRSLNRHFEGIRHRAGPRPFGSTTFGTPWSACCWRLRPRRTSCSRSAGMPTST